MKILVTGGAGFIGSHLVDRLTEEGYKLRVYDLLEQQVHQGEKPTYLNKDAEYIWGDVRDKDKLKKALEDIEKEEADYDFFNVGTGNPKTILDIADSIISVYDKNNEISAEILSKFRAGDIRHCFADITKISNRLGFKPKTSFQEGMRKLLEWSESMKAEDLIETAQEELRIKGLAE